MRPAPFTDVSEAMILNTIAKRSFIKNAGTIKRCVNKTTFKGYTFSGVAFYLAHNKTWRTSLDIDKDVTLLHAAVYFKSPTTGNAAALIVTCHSQDGKLWVLDQIKTSNGFTTENPLSTDRSVKRLKCFLSEGEEVDSEYRIANNY